MSHNRLYARPENISRVDMKALTSFHNTDSELRGVHRPWITTGCGVDSMTSIATIHPGFNVGSPFGDGFNPLQDQKRFSSWGTLGRCLPPILTLESGKSNQGFSRRTAFCAARRKSRFGIGRTDFQLFGRLQGRLQAIVAI